MDRSPTQRPKVSPAFSYYNNRPRSVNNAESKNIKNNKKKVNLGYHLKHIPSYLIVIVIVGSVLYALTLSVQPRVLFGKTSTEGNLLRDQKIYERRIRQIMESSIFNRSKLTIDSERVSRQIENEFPEIQQSTIRLPIIGRQVVVGLEPATTAMILVSGSSRYILGSDGRALISLEDTSTSLASSLLIVIDDTKIEIVKGRVALPKEYVDFITTVRLQLSAKKISIKSVQLPNLINELRVVTTDKAYFIKFDMSGDARLQTGTFLAVRDRLNTQNIILSEYIDVRVPERAYYK